MVVRVARQFDYDGEFKIDVVVPPAVKGVTIEPAVDRRRQDEVKLLVKAPADCDARQPRRLDRPRHRHLQWHCRP